MADSIAHGKPGRNSQEERRDKVRKLVGQGLSVRLISERLGVARQTVQKDIRLIRAEEATA